MPFPLLALAGGAGAATAGTGAAALAGGAAFGSTALSKLGDYYKNRDKISRQNKQIARAERKDIQGWLGDMQQYALYNKAQLDQFEADIANLNKQYEFNGRARQEAIEAGLTQLADISDGFIERAFARNMKAAEASGRFLSTGQTGRTTKRMEGLSTKAVQGRGLAADAGSMERAEGSFMFRDKQAQFAQAVADQNAFNQVRPPILGPAPVAPQRRTRVEDNSNRDLMFGLAGAAMNGLSAYASALPNGGNGSPFDINKLFSASQGSQMAQMILGGAAGNMERTTSAIPQAGLTGPAQYFTPQAGSLGGFLGIPSINPF